MKAKQLLQALAIIILFFLAEKPTFAAETKSETLVSYLTSKGQPSSKAARKVLAEKNGIKNYRFTAKQNTELLKKLQAGNTPAIIPPAQTQKVEQKVKDVPKEEVPKEKKPSFLNNLFQMASQGMQRILHQDKTTASSFGHNDPLDSGVGTPSLRAYRKAQKDEKIKGEDNSKPTSVGVALPEAQLAKLFDLKKTGRLKGGKMYHSWEDCAAVRAAGVEFWNEKTKEWSKPVPITDFGPGKGPLKNKVGMDLCAQTSKDLGSKGMIAVVYRIKTNTFPDRAGMPYDPNAGSPLVALNQ